MATSRIIIVATLLVAGLVRISCGQAEGLVPSVLEALQAAASVENEIAWVKAISAVHRGTWAFAAPFNDRARFVEIAQYATSIKFVSASGTYSMYAQECSNPIWAMNNGYELSYVVDEGTGLVTGFADQANWNGDARYMADSCYGDTGVGLAPRSLDLVVYHACGTGDGGLHLVASGDRADLNGKEQGVDVYLGFDDAWATDCDGNALVARDCGILAIDNFLLHCSDEFATHGGEIETLSAQLSALGTRVTSAEGGIQTNSDDIAALHLVDTALDGRVTQNEADIASLQTQLTSTIMAEIVQLQDDLDAANARIDLFASFSAQSAPVELVGDELVGDDIGALSFSLKDTVMFSLLAANLVLMCFICCRAGLYKTSAKTLTSKYENVATMDNDESECSDSPVKLMLSK